MTGGELDGLVAVVTGGGSGIGAAVVDELSRRGAQVAAFDLRPPHPSPVVSAHVVDVTDDKSVGVGVRDVLAMHQRLDIVVCCAGIGAQGPVDANTDEEWRRVLDVNVMGIVRVVRAALPHLRRSPAAAIVNVGSVAATTGLPDRALYSASKGAVQALTLAMAADHVSGGIRVNAVNPGTAATPWVQRLLDTAADPVAERAALEARQPHGRLVTAREVALAVAYLAGPDSGSTVGAVLAVDGGMASLRVRATPAGEAAAGCTAPRPS